MNNLNNLSNSVAFFVLTDKNGIVTLLKNNGLVFDENHTSDAKLINMIFNSLYEDNAFKDNFLIYLNSKTDSPKGFANGDGLFSSTQLPSFNPPTNPTSSSSSLGGSSGGFFGGFNMNSVTSLVGTGLGFLSSSQAGKDQRAIAEANAQAAIANAQSQTEAIRGQLALEELRLNSLKAQVPPPAKNNTLLYVGLGVGAIVLIGGLIFAITKKAN